MMMMNKDVDALEPFRTAIRAKGMKITPYRMGIAMGSDWQARFIAWREEARATRNYEGKPGKPACPYTNPHSIQAWEDGVRWS